MRFILIIMICLTNQMILADEFPYLYRNAYYLGRGDTGIASADEEEAIFYNPAGIAKGTGIYKISILASPMLEVSKGTKDIAKQISLQASDPTETLRKYVGTPQHVGFNNFSGIIFRRVAIGAFVHNSTTAMFFKDHEKGAFESVKLDSLSDAGIVFSLAQDFKNSLYLGSTLKYLKRNQIKFLANATEANELQDTKIDDISMLGTGAGADLGFMYQKQGKSEFSVGLTVQDLGNTSFTPDVSTDLTKEERPLKDIKQTINLGFSFAAGTSHSKFKLLFDIRDLTNQYKMSPYKTIHLGSELTLKNFVGFTSGLNQGFPTFGAYVDLRFFRLDIGSYGEEVGENIGSRPDSRYFIKLSGAI